MKLTASLHLKIDGWKLGDEPFLLDPFGMLVSGRVHEFWSFFDAFFQESWKWKMDEHNTCLFLKTEAIHFQWPLMFQFPMIL